VTSVADTTSVVSANKRKEDWALVKKEAIDIAKTLPGDMNATLHSQLQNAEINGEKMAKKMEDVALVGTDPPILVLINIISRSWAKGRSWLKSH